MSSDSIIRITTIFIVYTFVVLITYFLLSVPVTLIFDGFNDADGAGAENEMTYYIPHFENVFTIALALFISLPIAWYIMMIFSREPAFYRRRY